MRQDLTDPGAHDDDVDRTVIDEPKNRPVEVRTVGVGRVLDELPGLGIAIRTAGISPVEGDDQLLRGEANVLDRTTVGLTDLAHLEVATLERLLVVDDLDEVVRGGVSLGHAFVSCSEGRLHLPTTITVSRVRQLISNHYIIASF